MDNNYWDNVSKDIYSDYDSYICKYCKMRVIEKIWHCHERECGIRHQSGQYQNEQNAINHAVAKAALEKENKAKEEFKSKQLSDFITIKSIGQGNPQPKIQEQAQHDIKQQDITEKVKCYDCGEMVGKYKINTHKQTECKKRQSFSNDNGKSKCFACGQMIETYKLMTHKNTDCPGKQYQEKHKEQQWTNKQGNQNNGERVKCFQCQQLVDKNMLKEHKRKNCAGRKE